MRDLMAIFAVLGSMFLIVTSLFLVAMFAANSYDCYSWHAATGDDTKVISLQCFVHKDNRWVDLDSYRKVHNLDVKQ